MRNRVIHMRNRVIYKRIRVARVIINFNVAINIEIVHTKVSVDLSFSSHTGRL